MATMDILEDLLILDHLVKEAGGASFLDDKLLVPSLNRGGLYGSAWELHDPITGATPESCARWGMDGAKLLLRVCADDPDSLKTLQICADAVSRLAQLNVPCFLEPLPVKRSGERFFNVTKEAAALAQLVGVASALGESSRGLWLKLPWCPDFQTVARSTTLPILLLGGPATGDATGLLEQIRSGLAAGSNVRGALVGRNVLYPGKADPLAVARAVHALIHQDHSLDEALLTLQESKEDEWVHANAPWHRL
jgi:DhnA family fructose-bisphosphate aldolase class Ia